MSSDPASIARPDFPIVRRGYEPAAVDAHLDALAHEAAQDARRPGSDAAALGAQTGDRVAEIVEAAQRSAEGIREAARVEAAAHVADVERAAAALREHIVALDAELSDALEDLRARVGSAAEHMPAAPRESAAGDEAATASVVPDQADAEGARIVALEMALRGAPRAEAERYLAEHYDLPDRQSLLDEVYTVAGA